MKADVPEKLRPYQAHGLPMSLGFQGKQCKTDCVFCGKEGKFSINVQTGQWRCWSCAAGSGKGGGNVYTFIRMFHELCMEQTSIVDYNTLVNDRGYLDAQVLIEWQVCKSITTGHWLVPGYNPQGKLTTLYRWIKTSDGSRKLIPTPTLGHQIHGMNLWSNDKAFVYILEGPWDAMALWECFVQCKQTDNGLRLTANRNSSLFGNSNIIAVPGCEVWFDSWSSLLDDRVVNILFDSDHPRKNPRTGKIRTPVGWAATERLIKKIVDSPYKPQGINCLQWGPDGYDPKHKSGYDVRDFILHSDIQDVD